MILMRKFRKPIIQFQKFIQDNHRNQSKSFVNELTFHRWFTLPDPGGSWPWFNSWMKIFWIFYLLINGTAHQFAQWIFFLFQNRFHKFLQAPLSEDIVWGSTQSSPRVRNTKTLSALIDRLSMRMIKNVQRETRKKSFNLWKLEGSCACGHSRLCCG